MRRARKVVALLLALALSMTMLIACGKEKDTPTGGTPSVEIINGSGKNDNISGNNNEGKNPVTLSTVSMFGGTDANAGNYQAIIEEFISTYNYITVEDDTQASTQDWKTKIAADFAVGNEPDVIQFFTDANASDVLAADKFVTIEEIKAVYPEYAEDILDDALVAAANLDGVQRAVPTNRYWEGLFCNKDLFDKYNLELPTDWNKLLIAIETFKANDIIPISVSLNEIPHYWVEYMLLTAAGIDGYTQVPTEAPAEWIKGIEMIKTLKDMGAFPVDTDSIDNAFAGTLFYEKKSAMQLDGNWFLGGIPDQDNTVLCQFPIMDGGKAEPGAIVAGISSGFYITKKAWNDPDKRDAAVKFVMAHTKKESIQKYWGGTGIATAEVEPYEGMSPLAESGLAYSKAATSISTPTDSRISQEAYSALTAGIVEVVAGDKSAEDLINEVLEINAK